VFRTQGEGRFFERLLADGSDRFGVEVHAYCLMVNHYHLLVRCPHGGLSRFMQHVGASFTRAANRWHDRDGAVFRGRYRSILLDSPQHIAFAGRYIHRNPRDLRPPVDVERYRWSSLRYYAGHHPAPGWLVQDRLLDDVGGSRQRYAEFVGQPTGPLDARSLTALIAMFVDERGVSSPGSARALTIAVLDRCSHDVRRDLLRELRLTSPSALVAARANVRQRLERDLALRELFDEVLLLTVSDTASGV
jgi:REP element-mobilizing transposase RayT